MPEPDSAPPAGDSIRDDIAASVKELEAKAPSPPEPTLEPAQTAPEVKPDTITGDRPRDDKGRFIEKPKQEELKLGEPERKAEPEKPPEPAPKPQAEAPKAEPVKAEAQIPGPPKTLNLPATVREVWKQAPEPIREYLLKREGEIRRALNESTEARQGYQRFREAVSPFEAMIRSEGAEPVQAVQTLLNTAYALRTAPVPQRAAILADLVRTYLPGVEGIQLLDQTLSGSPVTQQGVQQVMRDPRLDQLLAQVEEAKQQRTQELDQMAATALSEVEAQEFFEDLRMDIADILDFAANRGLQMTPMDAYNRAAMLNPDVAKVVEQRKAAAANPNGSTQRAKDAASSVKSTPASGVRAPSQGGTLREDLEEVVKELSGNRGV